MEQGILNTNNKRLRFKNQTQLFPPLTKAPIEAKGDGRLLNALSIQDTVTGTISDLPVNGLFYAIGHKPNTDFLKGSKVDLDESGYIVTKLHEGHASTYTSVEGVFACGDVQDKIYRQAVTAAG